MTPHRALGILATMILFVGVSCHAPGSAGLGGSGGGGGVATSAASTSSGGGDESFFDAGAVGGGSMTGCSDAAAEPPLDAATGCDGLLGGVVYHLDVAPIFNASCNGELCHVAPTPKSMVGRISNECCDRPLVTPGDPAHSYLADKIRGVHLCHGGSMPLDHDPLSPADTTTILRWICEGAPDD